MCYYFSIGNQIKVTYLCHSAVLHFTRWQYGGTAHGFVEQVLLLSNCETTAESILWQCSSDASSLHSKFHSAAHVHTAIHQNKYKAASNTL